MLTGQQIDALDLAADFVRELGGRLSLGMSPCVIGCRDLQLRWRPDPSSESSDLVPWELPLLHLDGASRCDDLRATARDIRHYMQLRAIEVGETRAGWGSSV